MNNNYFPQNVGRSTPEQMYQMYPEVYRTLDPIVKSAADDIVVNGYIVTDELVASYVNSIIWESGMWDEDGGDAAVPAQMSFNRPGYNNPDPDSGFRPSHRRPHRPSRRPPHHNRNTLRDLARILLLGELLNRL